MIHIFKKGISQSCFLSKKSEKFAVRINHTIRIWLMCLLLWRYQIVSTCSRRNDWFVSTFQKYFLIQENPAGLSDTGAIVRGPKGAVSLPTEPHRLSHHCRHCQLLSGLGLLLFLCALFNSYKHVICSKNMDEHYRDFFSSQS